MLKTPDILDDKLYSTFLIYIFSYVYHFAKSSREKVIRFFPDPNQYIKKG